MMTHRLSTAICCGVALALASVVGCTRIEEQESVTLVSYDPVDQTTRPWLSGRDLFFTYSHGDTIPAYVDTGTGDTIPERVVRPDTLMFTGTTVCSLFIGDSVDTVMRDTCFMRIAAIPKHADTIAGMSYDTIWPLAFDIARNEDFSEARRVVRYLEHTPSGVYQRAWGDSVSCDEPVTQLALPLNEQQQFSTGLEWTCSPLMPDPYRYDAPRGTGELAQAPGVGIVRYFGDTVIYDETYKLYELVLLFAQGAVTSTGEAVNERLKVVYHRALELHPANKRIADRAFGVRWVYTMVHERKGMENLRRKEVTALRKRR
jgi:hypothetical protein